MIELVKLADTDRPVPGGWFGQTVCFVECFELVRDEIARCRAHVMKGD